MINVFIITDSKQNSSNNEYVSNENVKYTMLNSIAFAASSVKMLDVGKELIIVLLDTKDEVDKFLKACCYMGINYSKLSIITTENGVYSKLISNHSKEYIELSIDELNHISQ